MTSKVTVGSVFRRLTALLEEIGRLLAALLIAAVISVLLIKAIGGNVSLALWSLWDGAFGSPYNLGSTLVSATPLIFTGLGLAIAFRSRMWNIGGEGQFLVGCLTSSALALNCHLTGSLPPVVLVPVMLIGSAIAGALWAGIAAALKTWRDVPEVISTIMLNFVAVELLAYLVSGPMERLDRSQPATDMLPNSDMLPLLYTFFHIDALRANILKGFSGSTVTFYKTSRLFTVLHIDAVRTSIVSAVQSFAVNYLTPTPLHLGFVLALLAVVIVAVFLNVTRTGFSMKLVGANSDAARLAGIPVAATLLASMIWSGALCGLAGGVQLCGTVGFIPLGYSPGFGFEAVAVALLGRLSPIGVILSAVFIGALHVGCLNMERTAGIAHEMGFIIQAVALLALLATQWSGWSTLIRFKNRKSAEAA